MSIVPVHGPHTWGQPFFAESDSIIVNWLGPMDLEFKSKVRQVEDSPDPYEWEFGDGTQVMDGFEVRHVFAVPGTFVVRMTAQTPGGPVTDQIEITLDGNGHRAMIEELQPKRKAKAKAA